MDQRGEVSQGLNPGLRVSLSSRMGAKHRANHHMSYVYACASKRVMHAYENMSRAFFRWSPQGSTQYGDRVRDIEDHHLENAHLHRAGYQRGKEGPCLILFQAIPITPLRAGLVYIFKVVTTVKISVA